MNRVPEIIELEGGKSNRNCNCNPRCNQWFKVDGIDIYCKKELEQLAINIFNMVNGTNIAKGVYSTRGWTTKQELELIQFVENNGVGYGTYSTLAAMFGKTRSAVKGRVHKLEREGRLSRKKENVYGI